MCGFAGQYNFNHQPVIKEDIENMGYVITHRGPDYVGYHYNKEGLGICHRRLSIIDLTEEANQPMANEDESIWIVFNGEITNYIELKSKLESNGVAFRTKSDTEIIIKMYEWYGIECLKQLNGMFAFVLWDSKNKRFLAARDRIGIKPFYYTLQAKCIIFASEIKSILEHPSVTKEMNRTAINNYLNFDHQIDQQTWFQDIFSLDPGHYILIENEHIKFKKFWDINFNVDYNRSFDSFVDELREITIDAVKMNWRSDVPVGAHLSGGIDSSSIVSIASAFNENIYTYSSAFDLGHAYDEREEIKIVSEKFKTLHHQFTVNESKLFEILPKIIWHLDEPTVGPAIIPMFYISQLIRETGIKVVNGGQGVDEMFAGYPTFFSLAARQIFESLKKKNHTPLLEYFYFTSYLKKSDYFKRKLKSASVIPSWLRSPYRYNTLDQVEHIHNATQGMDFFEKYTYTRLKYYLPALLQQEDRLSMASSIESRVPLLDNRILDLSLQIPSYYKIRQGTTKFVFRAAMRGIVPEKILENKVKRGYPTPISVWFSNSLFTKMMEALDEKNTICQEFIDTRELKNILMMQKINPQSNFSMPLWKFLVLKTWHEVNFS